MHLSSYLLWHDYRESSVNRTMAACMAVRVHHRRERDPGRDN